MNELREYILSKKHHQYRVDCPVDFPTLFEKEKLSAKERVTRRFEMLCEMEKAVLLPGEKICFLKTVKSSFEIYTEQEKEEIGLKKYHETGVVSNICPDYEYYLTNGLEKLKKDASAELKREIDALLALTEKYEKEAHKKGDYELEKVLKQVPRYPATSFREALQFFRIIVFALRLEGGNHITCGRFDKILFPYYEKDIKEGVLTKDEAYELVVDFFLSFNKDTDLYFGVQQGDNGQSMVLGGCDGNGGEIYNDLTEFALKASEENLMIDPKINLRVSSKTPIEVFEKGSVLTAAGLGFPQYSNDDIAIPYLINLGYEKEDAENYVVAACWEFIIPRFGMDVVNIDALSFAKIVDVAFYEKLEQSDSFDEFMEHVKAETVKQAEELCAKRYDTAFFEMPFINFSVHITEHEKGGKYNNFGFHGTGIATAADSLYAIKKYVFEESLIDKKTYIDAVRNDFEGNNELLHKLRYETAKMGQNVAEVDDIACVLFDTFAKALEGKTNARGGKYRAGTGSAMNYLWHVNKIGASPDGRRKGEPLGANYSPSLFAKIGGPMSIISSFTKPDLARVCNGGPLTLEFHAGMFDSPDATDKMARLVKAYIDMGGHQLQLNAVNVDKLLDAQKNPDNYSRLIVRIWGWSAYFTELDKEYQDHVIARQAYNV